VRGCARRRAAARRGVPEQRGIPRPQIQRELIDARRHIEAVFGVCGGGGDILLLELEERHKMQKSRCSRDFYAELQAINLAGKLPGTPCRSSEVPGFFDVKGLTTSIPRNGKS